jgi:hypothetical protein
VGLVNVASGLWVDQESPCVDVKETSLKVSKKGEVWLGVARLPILCDMHDVYIVSTWPMQMSSCLTETSLKTLRKDSIVIVNVPLPGIVNYHPYNASVTAFEKFRVNILYLVN